VITYRYQELSEAGVPRFPSYVGVRDDVKWTPVAKAAAPNQKGDTPLRDGRKKFWEITLLGTGHKVRFGKQGTNGQERDKGVRLGRGGQARTPTP